MLEFFDLEESGLSPKDLSVYIRPVDPRFRVCWLANDHVLAVFPTPEVRNKVKEELKERFDFSLSEPRAHTETVPKVSFLTSQPSSHCQDAWDNDDTPPKPPTIKPLSRSEGSYKPPAVRDQYEDQGSHPRVMWRDDKHDHKNNERNKPRTKPRPKKKDEEKPKGPANLWSLLDDDGE